MFVAGTVLHDFLWVNVFCTIDMYIPLIIPCRSIATGLYGSVDKGKVDKIIMITISMLISQ